MSMSPHIFMKVVEAALVPMREHGIHILNYFDSWLSHGISCVNTVLWCCQPFGSLGKLGKEQTLSCSRDRAGDGAPRLTEECA